MERAVIDRIEGELAVLLVGDDEKEFLLPLQDLPSGSEPGVWLKITLDGARVTQAVVDPETTRTRRSRIQEIMNRLLGKRT